MGLEQALEESGSESEDNELGVLGLFFLFIHTRMRPY